MASVNYEGPFERNANFLDMYQIKTPGKFWSGIAIDDSSYRLNFDLSARRMKFITAVTKIILKLVN